MKREHDIVTRKIRGTVAAAVLVLLCCASAYAAPVVINNSFSSLNISRLLDFREDRSGALTIEQVRDQAGISAWKSNDLDYVNFGYTTSAYWFRLAVSNRETIGNRLLLEIDFSSLDHVDFYYPDGRGGYNSINTGDMAPFAARGISDRNFIFPLAQDRGTETYYLRVSNQGSLRFQARIYTGPTLLEIRNRFLPLAWLLYGMILFTSIFYFFLFAFMRDRSYLYFSLITLCMFTHQIALRGFGFQYLWPALPWLNRVIIPSMMNGMGIFSALFLINILDMRATNRYILQGFRLFAFVVFPALEVCISFLSYHAVALAIYYALFAYGALLIPSLVYYVIRGNRFARYFATGGVVLMLTNFISSITAMGGLPVIPALEWSNELGQLLLIIVSSLGLVDRFWNMNRSLVSSERLLQEKNLALTRTNEELDKSLDEETALIRDVHDRVKNNMQVVCSLLNLQVGTVTNPEAAQALNDAVARILSMASIHERIYQAGNFSRVDMGSYLESLSRHLVAQYADASRGSEPIRIVSRLSPVFLPVNLAIPCGLLINELLTNAVKHGCRGAAEAVVELSLECVGGMLTLVIADNGPGIDRKSLDGSNSGTIGMQIIDALSSQVGAAIDVNVDHGTRVTVQMEGGTTEA